MNGPDDPLKRVIFRAAAFFVLVFAVLWLGICIATLSFNPTEDEPRMTLDQPVALVAGFAATAVATGTAAVLGIKVEEIRAAFGAASGESPTRTRAVGQALGDKSWLARGCYLYLAVGVVVLAVYLLENDTAPEAMATFALSAFGWMAGAFSAAFKPAN